MSEKGEIKRDKAKAQKNSGRGKYNKGDAVWYNFLVDYKEYKTTFGINEDVWAKVCSDTFEVDRDLSPLLKLIMGERKTRLGVMEWDWIVELVTFYAKHHDW